ncbi:cytochrome c-type biogenesis protein CcmH [Cupriavidus pauculus]|uniref:Cytochrome c-type biogenesis protein n=1 Tax=Cupriavidus pauculus TaxID=82633 RepID=A0A2N5C3U2_9BURK|nr:cytochrome c-type biogenesis protein CcmH [Cupriavidus pauculus]PLP96878.1 cytochrome C biogenesis protein [Cupriavidus pauculus]
MACLLSALAWQAAAAPLSDAELDARVHALSQQLRCLVCQNQTLADSNAELAVDLRRQIRAQLAQGASDTAIKDYLVQRYGDFVLYDPPFKPSTWLLWLGPFVLLAVVAGWLWRRRKHRPSLSARPPNAAAGRKPAVEEPAPYHPRSKWTTATLCVMLPPAAAMLYLHLGNPAAVMQVDDAHSLSGDAHTPEIAQIEAMVDQLARRLQAQPQDADGWAMLARSYTVLERFDDAAAAYARAVALAPDVAALRADYADVLASLNGGSLEGAAMEQIRTALAADPDDPKSLALAASAAAERGDARSAIDYWQHLYRLLPPDSQTAARVAANLAAARQTSGSSTSSK